MRHFIVSDLHGNGYVYDSILNFLHNQLEYGNDDITLHINGDLIDRGIDSGSMLVDIYNRINGEIPNNFKINYLGGNHELDMYKSYVQSKNCKPKYFLTTYLSPTCIRWNEVNGGSFTSYYLKKNYSIEEIIKICEFVGNLDIYHKFDQKLDDKQIALIHACYISAIEKDKELKIKDDNIAVNTAVWTRKDDLPFIRSLGNKNYFTIVGHTMANSNSGFYYDKNDNVLNIDGGCARFSFKVVNYLYDKKPKYREIEEFYMPYERFDEWFKHDLDRISHVPLIELDGENNRLKIFIFNYRNEIIRANYFENGYVYQMDANDISDYRRSLEENKKFVKRIRK